MLTAVSVVPILIVLFVAATALWVYQDATTHTEHGTPVYFSAGSIEVSSPTAWAVGCLCLWVFFTPL